jgi:hypothetical protein
MPLDAHKGHSFDEFRIRLTEAIAWVSRLESLKAPGDSLRIIKAEPRFFSSEKWTVEDICRDRRRLLGLPPRMPAPDLAGGRLLIHIPDENLSDGAAHGATDGFFDNNNVPAWDTWVAYFYESSGLNYLVSWVPPELIDLVGKGIWANPELCITWLDDFDCEARTLAREAGLSP